MTQTGEGLEDGRGRDGGREGGREGGKMGEEGMEGGREGGFGSKEGGREGRRERGGDQSHVTQTGEGLVEAPCRLFCSRQFLFDEC